MPVTTTPALPVGTFSSRPQPDLSAGSIASGSITSGSIALQPWRSGDVEAVLTAYTDPDTAHWHARTLDRDEAAAWIAHWPQRWADESGAGWAVEVQGRGGAGRVAGQTSRHGIDRDEAFVDLSSWVLPQFRGRGVASAALGAVTEFVFSLGVHRAQLDHSTANSASCRVAQKAGYVAEGTARARGLHADGWHDVHLRARLAR